MDLAKLFDMQQKLDDHIMNEHPELRGQNNLDWKILALQVELGECANEWRWFKKWSKDQRPRVEIFVDCTSCQGTGDANYEMIQEDAEGHGDHEYIECESCEGSGSEGPKNPLLEEYVDCLHFVLSIGLEINLKELKIEPLKNEFSSVLEAFRHCFNWTVNLDYILFEEPFSSEYRIERTYLNLFVVFVTLGEMLGFTWEQIEQVYFAKNAVNHERQTNGY